MQQEKIQINMIQITIARTIMPIIRVERPSSGVGYGGVGVGGTYF